VFEISRLVVDFDDSLVVAAVNSIDFDLVKEGLGLFFFFLIDDIPRCRLKSG
jgi:hypothetical protein